MLINKHIGVDDVDGIGVIGDLFQQELLTLDTMGKSRIQVWINSPGGSVVDGYAIYNAILKSKTKVDTYNAGIAASISAVIFQAGRKRIMADYSILMYHNPFGSDNTEMLIKMKESIVTMICSRSGMSELQCDQMMNRTTFMGADEARKLGLCDEIEVSRDFNRKRMVPAMNDSRSYWKEANKILNKLFTKDTRMIKVTNKLTLNPDASEDSIAMAVDAVLNRATKAEADLSALNKKSKEELDKMAKDLKEMEDKYNAMKKEYDTCKNELDTAKKEKDDAEAAAKKEKVKNMIAGFVKIGKIKNEAAIITKWEEKGEADFDGTKELLEGLPLNKQATIITVDTQEKGEVQTTAMLLMAKNRMQLQKDGRKIY